MPLGRHSVHTIARNSRAISIAFDTDGARLRNGGRMGGFWLFFLLTIAFAPFAAAFLVRMTAHEPAEKTEGAG